ncbi:hypothetical protein SADUNF_Sadunf10G0124600 [Salix dunnii]|uniref:Uncharacterized protein n=1 Tax=Salix dunnii TaxID=1413687 RepID=A0A835JR34_9ROSI|nr:hypothetical protein SADUNF_Sadunf10G0124600 [Salix dunnii]
MQRTRSDKASLMHNSIKKERLVSLPDELEQSTSLAVPCSVAVILAFQILMSIVSCSISGDKLEIEKLKGEGLDPGLEIAVGCYQHTTGNTPFLVDWAFGFAKYPSFNEVLKQRVSELDELECYQERRLKDLGFVMEQGEIIFWESKQKLHQMSRYWGHYFQDALHGFLCSEERTPLANKTASTIVN